MDDKLLATQRTMNEALNDYVIGMITNDELHIILDMCIEHILDK